MDRFLKTCLVLLVLFVAVIAFRPIVSPHSVHAQGKYKYLAVKAYGGTPSPGYGVQDILDKYAADGWELAAPFYVGQNPAGSTGEIYLIFRK